MTKPHIIYITGGAQGIGLGIAHTLLTDGLRDAIGREMMGVLYDACVIEWRSNIVDGDAPITCDRERFLALADVVAVPEIASALREFAEEAIRVGKAIAEDDEQTEKN